MGARRGSAGCNGSRGGRGSRTRYCPPPTRHCTTDCQGKRLRTGGELCPSSSGVFRLSFCTTPRRQPDFTYQDCARCDSPCGAPCVCHILVLVMAAALVHAHALQRWAHLPSKYSTHHTRQAGNGQPQDPSLRSRPPQLRTLSPAVYPNSLYAQALRHSTREVFGLGLGTRGRTSLPSLQNLILSSAEHVTSAPPSTPHSPSSSSPSTVSPMTVSPPRVVPPSRRVALPKQQTRRHTDEATLSLGGGMGVHVSFLLTPLLMFKSPFLFHREGGPHRALISFCGTNCASQMHAECPTSARCSDTCSAPTHTHTSDTPTLSLRPLTHLPQIPSIFKTHGQTCHEISRNVRVPS